ncbi:MAG: hypothetical protein QM610_07375 [Chitinophagaceae bacterium]
MLKKILGIVALVLVLVAGFSIWWNYYYVFGEGVKSGTLNYLVKKGNVFKTYEGKIIQSGFSAGKTGTLQSYDFEFSVEDDSLANVLMLNSGAFYELHYKEYKHAIPWRGYSPYIVDRIINSKPVGN